MINLEKLNLRRASLPIFLAIATYVLANVALAASAGNIVTAIAHAAAGALVAIVFAATTRAAHETAGGTHGSAGDPALPDIRLIRVLASIIDSEDPYTSGRSYRVSRFSRRIGRHFQLPEAEIQTIELAALLHDIGRAAIRHDVFKQMFAKRGRLTDRERALMSTHPQTGYYILRDVRPLQPTAELIRSHHEQPDGKGYPDGLRGEAIPFGSRVIMVAAAFDAMTSDRPYRSGMTAAQACDELRRGAGTMFDARIVDALVDLYRSGALFDDIDRSELELHSSFHGRSLAVEEFLARSGGGAQPAVEGAAPTLADLEIDLGLDASKGDEERSSEAA